MMNTFEDPLTIGRHKDKKHIWSRLQNEGSKFEPNMHRIAIQQQDCLLIIRKLMRFDIEFNVGKENFCNPLEVEQVNLLAQVSLLK